MAFLKFCGLLIIILAVLFTAFILSWVLRILGVIGAVLGAMFLFGCFIVYAVIDWFQYRASQREKRRRYSKRE